MKKELEKLVEKYDKNEIILEELIYYLNVYDRKRFRLKSKSLIKELHPTLQAIFGDTIKMIENETNMVFSGIKNSLENKNTDLKSYHVIFQHKHYFTYTIEFTYGQIISKGCDENETWRFHDDKKIRLGITTPSCMALYGEYDANDENIMQFIVEGIKNFDKKIENYEI